MPLLLNGPVPQTKAPLLKKEFLIIPGSDHRPSETGFWAQIRLENHHNGLLFLPAQASLAAIPSHAPVYQNQYGLLRQERQSLELDYWDSGLNRGFLLFCLKALSCAKKIWGCL